MQIQGSRVLILGGSGLVGMAVARQLMHFRPAAMTVCGLTRAEAEEAVEALRSEPGADGVQIDPEWGDLFLPAELKEQNRRAILTDRAARAALLDSLYGPLDDEAVESSTFGALLLRRRPEILIDCVNTATVFAYQNVFSTVGELWDQARAEQVAPETVERHLATLYLPQLIRHVQLALESMRRVGTRMYIKIGTAGTGGMGLNVPFTHSEERPSRVLLAKASVAGAHTLLLFLMARTPGAPAVKEIKPTAAISWKRIGYGAITRGGRPVRRSDAVCALRWEEAFTDDEHQAGAWKELDETLRGVFLDAGENGLFSPAEFETLSSLGLMEFITPEEIADDVVRELRGYPTGHDVVAALDASTSGPTYRAGVLRQSALDRMDELERQHEVESVAYEMLGPPRLSKLLFEAAILARLTGADLAAAAEIDPDTASSGGRHLIEQDTDLRTRILSIGLPILLPDGEHLLRGASVEIKPDPGEPPNLDRLADAGWVDLRARNWERWRTRAAGMFRATDPALGAEAGSRRDLDPTERSRRLRPGALAAWVFRFEDGGERIKR